MMFPCIIVTYSCFLHYCEKSVSSLSRSVLLPSTYLPFLQNKFLFLFLFFPKRVGVFRLQNVKWQMQQKSWLSQPQMCTESAPNINSIRITSFILLLRRKSRTTEKTDKWVSVWWKTKSQRWRIYTSHIHWVTRGTGTPKDKDEVNKGEVCECDGCVWFRIYRKLSNKKKNQGLRRLLYRVSLTTTLIQYWTPHPGSLFHTMIQTFKTFRNISLRICSQWRTLKYLGLQ